MKIKVCTYEQYKYIKNKRKNRRTKIIINRLINKRRRTYKLKYYNHY